MSSPLFVYGNWAAYDELSDGVPLTEELAMRQLSELLRLRKAGVRFDAYLMDAFWYAPDGAYRAWRKPHWPDGPDRWLDACHEHGLLPGLWFTANTVFHMDVPPAWADSVDAKTWGMCLFQGGFLNDFMAVLDYWYSRGIRIFKLDFAEFNAVPAGLEGQIPAPEARIRNVAAYRKALAKFKGNHPEAIFMAFNGFDDRECMDRSDRPPGTYIDPVWLDVMDSIYCGDPRPSDLPCGSFWRSVDIYSDCMVRLFESSGIPLDRIDNCAFMAGPTGTCYWRGKAAWKGMLLLSLARGGQIHVSYGDLSQFSDEDGRWWAEAQGLYAPTMVRGCTEHFGGWPGAGESYGWLSKSDSYEVATVVNPAVIGATLLLPPAQHGSWKMVSADPGGEAALFGETLSLQGGQMAVLVSDQTEPHLTLDEVISIVQGMESLAKQTGSSPLLIEIPTATESRSYRLVVRQTDEEGCSLRTYPNPDGRPPFQVTIVKNGQGTLLPTMFDKTIWSGISWWVVDFAMEADSAARHLEISSANRDNPRVDAELFVATH